MTGQDKFEVEKSKLLAILEENRAKHIKDHAVAIVGFERKVLREMKKNLKQAEEGGEIVLHSKYSKPTLHEDEYDNVIGLLELTTETKLKITWADYKKYVRDDWSWNQSWYGSNSGYIIEGELPTK
jgi:hypothetical protein